jgi:hypothetical protein
MAMQRSRLALRRYREERREAVRQMVGRHWSEEGTQEKVPVNLISKYVKIVGRSMVPKEPRVLLSTFDRAHKPMVSACQTWVNKEIEQLRLANTLQRCVIDGLFSIGICKVALGTPADSARMSWNLKAGSVFCERVDLDDFVFDIHARDFQECSFIGHRYRVPLEVIREDKHYNRQAREALVAHYDQAFNLEGDERISMLGRSYYGIDSEEFEDLIDLWEVYLPRHRLVLTLADDSLTGANESRAGGAGVPLREQPWLGPDTGPYHLLGYERVPGNPMPKGPIQDLLDLHYFINNVFRKLMRQAERQKELTGVAMGATEDGSRILEANDGDIVRLDRPESIKPFSHGAPNQQNFGMFGQAYDLFNREAGNLELMGGEGPQSRTLGQDKMLNANASGQITDMQDQTTIFVADVVKAMMWYWWHDPQKVMRSLHSVQGLPEFNIQRFVKPQDRQRVNFAELDIRIDPYSLRHQTPQERMAAMQQVVTQTIIPMMQLLVQQGIAFDANAYLEKLGQYMDAPDLAEILTIMEPPQMSSPGMNRPGKPGTTSRTYERHSSGAASRHGTDIGRMNAMAPKPNGQAQTNGSPMR